MYLFGGWLRQESTNGAVVRWRTFSPGSTWWYEAFYSIITTHPGAALELLYGIPVWLFGQGPCVAARGLNSLCLYLHSVEIEERGVWSFSEADPHSSFHQPSGWMFSCSAVDGCSFLSNSARKTVGKGMVFQLHTDTINCSLYAPGRSI